MTTRRAVVVILAVITVAVAAWGTTQVLERLMAPRAEERAAAAGRPAQPAPVAHITATLFYGSSDGQYLVPIRREVPLADTPAEQGKQIVLALLQEAPAGVVPPMPPGTTLRAFYVTDRGEAFVDLSREASANHPGGSTSELFTVYALVNAITTNLPAISRVQILIDGKEVDTLAGHVDLRRPLQQNLSLIRPDTKTQ